MTMKKALMRTEVSGFEPRRGKVRDIYDLGDRTVIIIATDRISAFDVIMENGIPGKGEVLTALTEFWFELLDSKTSPNHFISSDLYDLPVPFRRPEFRGRTMLCKKAEPLPVECVVRGYLAGSGWKDYQETQMVCGIKLSKGLKQCQRLPESMFTPATKAKSGHDENITFDAAKELVGAEIAEKIWLWSIDLYQAAHDFASNCGVIIADTKFEFGEVDGEIILIDEVLTPDSSRFWPADQYEPGHDQPSYDKQYVRNYLQGLCDRSEWNKVPPGPELPNEIVKGTQKRYSELQKLLIGGELAT